jgi:antitoxin component HigA of HigAB toxin-antitoxin module
MNLLSSKYCAILFSMAELLNMMRTAMESRGQSRYRISKETGIAESVLSRFMSRETALTVETVERLADYLGLEIVLRPKRGRGARKGG